MAINVAAGKILGGGRRLRVVIAMLGTFFAKGFPPECVGRDWLGVQAGRARLVPLGRNHERPHPSWQPAGPKLEDKAAWERISMQRSHVSSQTLSRWREGGRSGDGGWLDDTGPISAPPDVL
ncbi:uncharacterized protein ColSpa_03249 [Colletotrichum spaethianum]|uniref:Uncharacterized protein n=1 Tax=Colletotrichum spaethianum TaxID=700344 RepID=A0AA37LB45_9PEZI|nr:uncharacterized protein ColSpa_03249 [Colletotrichum spaethianum]GKT43068.1 hypothetical protein ColSpa_03249 [Colletotrichum spaethianum]